MLKSEGVLPQAPIAIEGVPFCVDLYIMPLAGFDLVLETQWIATLGPIVWDIANHTMQLQLQGRTVRWSETMSTATSAVGVTTGSDQLLDALLAHFTDIFAEPTGLPPQRGRDHRIILVPGVASVAVRPYRYPAAHKDELERQCTAMISQGIVRRSYSIFSSSVLLIKKPDGPWRFCIDYRALNALTVKDAFPIPVVVELLDELNGARFFTKLDLRSGYHKDELERQCTAMISQGIVRRSYSIFSSSVLLIKKPDGSWRFCIDYRALNALTVKDAFPIPVVVELLDELNGAWFFTKLDLCSGYHQVRMRTDNIHKAAFRTHDGLYEFRVVSFGLCNASVTFQALMNDVLRPFLHRFVLVFFDDILIYSSTWADHLRHLRTVLAVLQQHQLFVKQSKCAFGVPSVAYLGHVISASGVAMDPAKVQAVHDWPQPRSTRAVRGFLGLAGYYRKFVHDYDTITTPLTALLKKEGFTWSAEAAAAFARSR
jgi:hypothetical protein